MRTIIFTLALCVAAWAQVEDRQTIQKTFTFSASGGTRQVTVDTLSGAIDVTGYSGSEVQLTVEKTLRADSADKAQEANRDVKLDIAQQDNSLRLYVDGPFRCHCADGSTNFRGSRHYGYDVNFDFHLKVPRDTALDLRTVNHGHIRIENTEGNFNLEEVNGEIEMREVSGSGRVRTINGPLKVSFAKNPSSASSFSSVNGEVELSFQPDLSADFRLKTFNGQVYTDFPVTYLPTMASAAERRGGKYVYRSNDFFGVRVGRGGPEYKIDTLNGSIRILTRGK